MFSQAKEMNAREIAGCFIHLKEHVKDFEALNTYKIFLKNPDKFQAQIVGRVQKGRSEVQHDGYEYAVNAYCRLEPQTKTSINTLIENASTDSVLEKQLLCEADKYLVPNQFSQQTQQASQDDVAAARSTMTATELLELQRLKQAYPHHAQDFLEAEKYLVWDAKKALSQQESERIQTLSDRLQSETRTQEETQEIFTRLKEAREKLRGDLVNRSVIEAEKNNLKILKTLIKSSTLPGIRTETEGDAYRVELKNLTEKNTAYQTATVEKPLLLQRYSDKNSAAMELSKLKRLLDKEKRIHAQLQTLKNAYPNHEEEIAEAKKYKDPTVVDKQGLLSGYADKKLPGIKTKDQAVEELLKLEKLLRAQDEAPAQVEQLLQQRAQADAVARAQQAQAQDEQRRLQAQQQQARVAAEAAREAKQESARVRAREVLLKFQKQAEAKEQRAKSEEAAARQRAVEDRQRAAAELSERQRALEDQQRAAAELSERQRALENQQPAAQIARSIQKKCDELSPIGFSNEYIFKRLTEQKKNRRPGVTPVEEAVNAAVDAFVDDRLQTDAMIKIAARLEAQKVFTTFIGDAKGLTLFKKLKEAQQEALGRVSPTPIQVEFRKLVKEALQKKEMRDIATPLKAQEEYEALIDGVVGRALVEKLQNAQTTTQAQIDSGIQLTIAQKALHQLVCDRLPVALALVTEDATVELAPNKAAHDIDPPHIAADSNVPDGTSNVAVFAATQAEAAVQVAAAEEARKVVEPEVPVVASPEPVEPEPEPAQEEPAEEAESVADAVSVVDPAQTREQAQEPAPVEPLLYSPKAQAAVHAREESETVLAQSDKVTVTTKQSEEALEAAVEPLERQHLADAQAAAAAERVRLEEIERQRVAAAAPVPGSRRPAGM